LVGLVKHKPSYVPVAREIANILKIETVDRFDTLSGETIHLKICFISSGYLYANHLGKGFIAAKRT